MGYRIKTVSEMTGIQRATLLAWERRYRLVSPTRHSNGYREYSEQDLARLLALKRLLDRGYKVSEAISLMRGTPSRGAPRAPEGPRSGVAYAALHDSLRSQREASGLGSGPQLVLCEPTLERFLEAELPEGVEVLVLRLELMGPDPVRVVRSLRLRDAERGILVIYEFAPRRVLERLERLGVHLAQGPLRLAALQQRVEALAEGPVEPPPAPSLPPAGPVPPGQPVPAPRFGDEDLGRLRELRSGLDCECPNHLASIVTALRAFERYSAGCQSEEASEVALHAWLGEGAGRARALVEDLLLRVCEQERIRI